MHLNRSAPLVCCARSSYPLGSGTRTPHYASLCSWPCFVCRAGDTNSEHGSIWHAHCQGAHDMHGPFGCRSARVRVAESCCMWCKRCCQWRMPYPQDGGGVYECNDIIFIPKMYVSRSTYRGYVNIVFSVALLRTIAAFSCIYVHETRMIMRLACTWHPPSCLLAVYCVLVRQCCSGAC